MLFPEIQAKAQAQIDEVVGPGRLPTMDDFDRLPYIRQVIKETLRCMQQTAQVNIMKIRMLTMLPQGFLQRLVARYLTPRTKTMRLTAT